MHADAKGGEVLSQTEENGRGGERVTVEEETFRPDRASERARGERTRMKEEDKNSLSVSEDIVKEESPPPPPARDSEQLLDSAGLCPQGSAVDMNSMYHQPLSQSERSSWQTGSKLVFGSQQQDADSANRAADMRQPEQRQRGRCEVQCRLFRTERRRVNLTRGRLFFCESESI
ncbi:unnamed protein product [Pleuronectes platessa]|uniref:Uncharacterized protein n=1 Tax=Pleuronectes platessa TaxID=8262 RepID=A0A9N7YJH5_PLEPL|nr:unnamed protein product [Pleuronectes platessa]